MSYFFSSMELPHWLIVAGAVLLIFGFIGLALFGRSDASDYEVASGEEQGRSEPNLAPDQAGDRNAKLEERKRDRWASKDRSAEKPLNDRPKVSDKETR